MPLNTDPHCSKALLCKIAYESLSPYFAFRLDDVIQNTLRQTSLLAKSTIYSSMRSHLNTTDAKT
jgi:hypothetical protein